MRKPTLLTFAFVLLLWLLLTTSTFDPEKQGERGRLAAQSYEATPCLIIERPRTSETDIEIICSNGYARQFIRRAPHPSNNPLPIVGNHAYSTRATTDESTQSYSLDFSEVLRTFPELALPYWQQSPGANIALPNRMAAEQVQANYLWTCFGAGGPSCYDHILGIWQQIGSERGLL